MNEKAELITAFSEMAPRYEQVVDGELKRFWGWSYRGFVDLMLASTPIEPQDIVLDVATGTGVIPSELEKAGHPPGRIHGLDITLPMLEHARLRLEAIDKTPGRNLVCASAMDMPYQEASFTRIFCGLATHHMDVGRLLQECQRVLRSGGGLTIADAGGARLWKIPGVRLLLRMAAIFYFMLFENKIRARAEARAVSNVLSGNEWNLALINAGFRDIVIRELKSRYFWVPSPLLITAKK